MIWLENRDIGKLCLFLTSVAFVYYTLWVIVLPFVDEKYMDFISRFFPPLELALIIPAAIGSTVFVLLLTRAYHLVEVDRAREKDNLVSSPCPVKN